MAMLMPETEMMVEEPADQAMVSDEQMEDDYLDFVVEQALEPEEQELLMDVLDESPQPRGINPIDASSCRFDDDSRVRRRPRDSR